MSVQFNIGGTIKTPTKVQANIGGVIKEISKIQANIGGVIKEIWSAASGIDAYVMAMLHFNGTDASTTFTDETGKTWTRQGNAQIDTARKKFGTASGLFDGTGDYIDTPDSADFDVGSGDFTVDFWLQRGALGALTVFGQGNSSLAAASTSMRCRFASDIPVFAVSSGGTAYTTSAGATAITADSAWHHIAVVRYGNTLTLYLDGVAQGTADVTGVTVNNSSNKFAIGRPGEYNGYYFKGWIDEFRFSKGIARWTTNFTPPTSEYTA